MRLASSLAETLLARGIARKLDEELVPDNMVPLVTGFGKTGEKANILSPFALNQKVIDSSIKNIYVDKKHAAIIKTLVDCFDS